MSEAAPADRGVGRTLDEIAVTPAAPAAPPVAGALVLHDDEATRAALEEALARAGLGVAFSASVFDLVLRAPAAPPRLLLLALTSLEDRDLEVVTRLRERWPQTFVVALHPASLRERSAKALALGADASLQEPFYPSEIESLARRAVARTSGDAPAVPSAASAAVATSPPPAENPAAASRLAEGVARALRRPLDALSRALADLETSHHADAAAARAEAARIVAIADGLDAVAGPSGLELVPVDVANLVTGVFMSRDVGAAGAEIGVRLGDALVEVLAAPDLLRAGLEWVRNRAVRVTPPEGRISVRTRTRDDAGRRVVEISVIDGGPALPPERLAALFDPFEDAGDGDDDDTHGLEMAALAGVVTAHGGALLALPAGATGTIVMLRLPVVAAPNGRPDVADDER